MLQGQHQILSHAAPQGVGGKAEFGFDMNAGVGGEAGASGGFGGKLGGSAGFSLGANAGASGGIGKWMQKFYPRQFKIN